MAERFDGPVDIDGSFAEPGLLRVNGTVQIGPVGGGEGVLERVGRIEHVARGEIDCGRLVAHDEIECGHLVAHGDAPTPAANFGSHVGVEGNIDVSGSINVGGEVHVMGSAISEKLAEIEERLSEISRRTQMPDGRSVVNAIGTLEDRVKNLVHDTKPWYRGGRIFG